MRIVRTAALLAVVATLSAAFAVPATAAVTGHTGKRMHKPIVLDDPLATAGDAFGHQVAIDGSGTEILVGAHLSHSGSGKAYFYESKSGKWPTKPTVKFADPATGANHYGFSVALSPNGTTAYVGADQVTVGGKAGAGAVFVYQSSHGKWPAKPTQTIDDPGKGTNDYFGIGMTISSDGGTLVVGSPGFTSNAVGEVGRVYVYTASRGKFPSTPSATISSPTPSTFGLFGYSTSVSDNAKGHGSIVVGAYSTSTTTVSNEGAAYIYSSKGIHSWKLAKGGSLKDPGNKGADFFGGVVAIDGAGTTVMIGAQDETEKTISDAGAVFTYVLKTGTWKASQTLDGPANGPANFAYPSISSNGKVAVTAAPSAQVNGHSGAGEAFLYGASGTTLSRAESVPDPTGGSANSPEYFGNASALNAAGTMSVIAAPATGGTGGNNGPGAVYVYSIS
jgi:hypothetical protein